MFLIQITGRSFNFLPHYFTIYEKRKTQSGKDLSQERAYQDDSNDNSQLMEECQDRFHILLHWGPCTRVQNLDSLFNVGSKALLPDLGIDHRLKICGPSLHNASFMRCFVPV